MENSSRAARVAAVTALDDPSRLALYDLVSRSTTAVSRDEAASALGLSRSTAAFHLDRLADEGLLAVQYKRLSGKTGPGSGRPAKLYTRAPGELAVSVPQRDYELAGDLLAGAIEESNASGKPVREVLRTVAGKAGREIGSASTSFEAALEETGFEPQRDDDGDIVFGNCPFHQLARRHTEIVCDFNYELVRGIAEGADQNADGCCHSVGRDAEAGRCCVRATPSTKPAS